MMGMSQEEAERVEIEVLQTPGAFAIWGSLVNRLHQHALLDDEALSNVVISRKLVQVRGSLLCWSACWLDLENCLVGLLRGPLP
jgi:hypothetical protein